jgi:hypothetical protein
MCKVRLFFCTPGTHVLERGLTDKARPVSFAPEPITYSDNNIINIVRVIIPRFRALLASPSVQLESLVPFSSPLFSATSTDSASKIASYRHRPILPATATTQLLPVSPHPVNIQHPVTPANPFSSIVCFTAPRTTGGEVGAHDFSGVLSLSTPQPNHRRIIYVFDRNCRFSRNLGLP